MVLQVARQLQDLLIRWADMKNKIINEVYESYLFCHLKSQGSTMKCNNFRVSVADTGKWC
jgi:hypothetical protein